jgi:hypothetical protein
MTISRGVWEQVRQRARLACEFCGVSEVESGGELTVDHYQPSAAGGVDDLENLLYCCFRCNTYKAGYWPTRPDEPSLWNPRREAWTAHFIQLADGRLYPLTNTGRLTVHRLRLNRPQLVGRRLRDQRVLEEERLTARLRELLQLLEQLQQQHLELLEEHRRLLERQRELLRLRLRGKP